jgi:hypothetical protein
MADRVVLHVGVLKSGTSYVQQRMLAAAETLAEHGLLFPSPWNKQVTAVSDVLGIRRRARGDFEGAWARLAEEVNAWPGTALISMEFLGPARDAQVAEVVGSFPGTPVEVIVTARDLNRTITAMWQESLKNSGHWDFTEYVGAIQRDEGVGSRFWRQHRLAVIVRRWAAHVGLDRVTLVTLPPPGAPPETLWLRFCEAARIDPSLCPPAPPVNESLGVPSAEVLRLVNERLGALDIPWQQYSKNVKFAFAKEVLAERRREEPALGMPVPPWVERRSASMRANLAETGVRVVGSLDDLEPVAVPGATPAEVSTEDTLAAAVDALAALLRRTIEAELPAPLPSIDSPGAEVVDPAVADPQGVGGS